MEFLNNPIWWIIFVLASVSGFVQLLGYYGRGSGSKKIEKSGFMVVLVFFFLTFYFVDFLGGIILIFIFILVNSTLTKYFVKTFFKKTSGYVPLDREEMRRAVMEEFMETKTKFSLVEVELEVDKRLGIND